MLPIETLVQSSGDRTVLSDLARDVLLLIVKSYSLFMGNSSVTGCHGLDLTSGPRGRGQAQGRLATRLPTLVTLIRTPSPSSCLQSSGPASPSGLSEGGSPQSSPGGFVLLGTPGFPLLRGGKD